VQKKQEIDMFAELTNRLNRYIAHRAALAELNGMDDRELKDVGLTRGDIAHALYRASDAKESSALAPKRSNEMRRGGGLVVGH
jgi:uncharacterized protein YjiS (DUF1127 family)